MIALPSAADDVELRTGFEVCTFIDELGPAAIGEIIVRDRGGGRGAVFVERGRICWAAARGLAQRLTELLVVRARLQPHVMESLFLSCKRDRLPLGEQLVTRGMLSADALRETLLQHTLESLEHLCGRGARGAWCPRSGNGYSPRFTFATAELLAGIGAIHHAAIAPDLHATIRATFDPDEWGAAFVRDASSAFPEPVAVVGEVPHRVATLVRFGKWAASVLDVAAAFADETALFCFSRPEGKRPLVVFRRGAAIFVGETSTYGPARILNRRARARRTKGANDADL